MNETAVSRRTEIILISLLLIAAAVLRMGWPGLTEFKADEARLLALALDMAEGQFALRGISSSVGFPNFPASVWIYSIPLFVWPHPYAATIFTGLLNTAAIAASYWFVRRYWGISAALAATLMLTVSPWAIIFSRKIWAQNLLPLFIVGWAIGAALAFVERRQKYIWLHFVCLALSVQIHLAAIALVPVTVILLIIFWQRVSWKSVLIGALLAAFTIVPFLTYIGRTWQQTGIPPGLPSGTISALTLDAFNLTTMLSLGTNIHSLAGPEAFRVYLTQLPPMTWVYVIWASLILGGIALFIGRLFVQWEHRATQVGLIVLLWLLVPPLFFLWHSTPVFLHYFIATLPAQFILAGVAFSCIAYGVRRIWPQSTPHAIRNIHILSWSVLLTTAIFQLFAIVSLLNFVSTTNTPAAMGTPLAFKLAAVDEAKQLLAETNAREILAVGPGEFPKVDDFPAVYAVLLRDTPHRFVDSRRDALFPAQDAVVLLDGKEMGNVWTGDLYLDTVTSASLSTSVSITEFPLRPGEGSLYVLSLPGDAKPAPETAVEPPILLANWVNLLGHDGLEIVEGETAVWQVHWRTGDNPDPAGYQFFNHLIDSNGERISQLDAPAFAPNQWRAGDILISRFLLPMPESIIEPLTMRTGMYQYPSLENVPLLDVAGNPYNDAAEFQIQDEE
ncbi:MAG: hypothetical protein KDE48_14500 [Anaerolineales bacterium]|nr:hypothetical protein [Anaerolineales bacterium]